jgi:hypothetical protein
MAMGKVEIAGEKKHDLNTQQTMHNFTANAWVVLTATESVFYDLV